MAMSPPPERTSRRKRHAVRSRSDRAISLNIGRRLPDGYERRDVRRRARPTPGPRRSDTGGGTDHPPLTSPLRGRRRPRTGWEARFAWRSPNGNGVLRPLQGSLQHHPLIAEAVTRGTTIEPSGAGSAFRSREPSSKPIRRDPSGRFSGPARAGERLETRQVVEAIGISVAI